MSIRCVHHFVRPIPPRGEKGSAVKRSIIMILRVTAVAGAALLSAGAATAATPAPGLPFGGLRLLPFERGAGDAEQPVRTVAYGGNGGGSFDDSPDINKWGRINLIAARHAAEVDAIGVGYVSGDYVNHGGTGGTETYIKLAPDEDIVA